MIVIMMGPPGAGKGTQAGRLARERGMLKVSTGDILRDGIKAQLPMAIRAQERMDRGELVDDETMVDIVREWLSRANAAQGVVLDGFPRTVAQAEALDRLVKEGNTRTLIIVDVRVPEHELVRRLAGRLICASCGANAALPADGSPAATVCQVCGGHLVQRTDDNEGVVRARLKVYERETKPLVEFYRDRSTFRVINGAQAQERVAHELDTVIDDAAASARAAAPARVEKAAHT